MFARRGYNVQSLAVGPSEREGMSRICMVVPGTQQLIDKLLRQLNKLVFVENVTDLTNVPFVNRELMLVKVSGVCVCVVCVCVCLSVLLQVRCLAFHRAKLRVVPLSPTPCMLMCGVCVCVCVCVRA